MIGSSLLRRAGAAVAADRTFLAGRALLYVTVAAIFGWMAARLVGDGGAIRLVLAAILFLCAAWELFMTAAMLWGIAHISEAGGDAEAIRDD
jgi:hypothetical protein